MSKHFDGKKFYNPTLEKQFEPGISHMWRMLREERTPWPRYVPSRKATTDLSPPAPGDIGLTFVNHATFLIQMDGLNILTDPIWSDRASPFSWLGPKRVRKPGIPFQNLPPIDLILLSHNHYDHLDVKTLKKLNQRFAPQILVALGDGALVRSIGFEQVREMGWWDEVDINSKTTITFAPAQHFSGRGLWDRYRSLWGSYFIQQDDRSVYYGADSGYATHFTEIKSRIGSPEIALLGIGAYSPNWFMKPIHMNPAEAVQAHLDLDAHKSIGMHFGTFRLSSEGIDHPARDLKEALEQKSIPSDHFIVLEEGERLIASPI